MPDLYHAKVRCLLMRRAAFLFIAATGCAAPKGPAKFSATVESYHEGARIAVVGDMQRTAPTLEFWREQNDGERRQVVEAIAEAKPSLLMVTGDNVFNGGSHAQWESFDELTAPLRKAEVPVATAFGNHEYWVGLQRAEAHVFPRFALNAGRHWFTIPFGPLRLVVLDSNESELTPVQWSSQATWFAGTLEMFDHDDGVRGVVVLFHHPPFTNSSVTGDEIDVQEAFVPPFKRAHKTIAMLNGHVHSYERYMRDGKTYVVSGGGGGPRARLKIGDGRRHKDDQCSEPALRDFHFALYTVNKEGVSTEVRGLPKGGTVWRVLDRFDLQWPALTHVISANARGRLVH